MHIFLRRLLMTILITIFSISTLPTTLAKYNLVSPEKEEELLKQLNLGDSGNNIDIDTDKVSDELNKVKVNKTKEFVFKEIEVPKKIIKIKLNEPIEYYPRFDETIEDVAEKFNISSDWIMDSNKDLLHPNLSRTIKYFTEPGNSILIPHKEGIAYKVKKGEDIKIKLKEIGMSEQQFIDENKTIYPKAGQIVLLPPVKKQNKVFQKKYGQSQFAWGHCTWYVAGKVNGVAWRGNANRWLNNAINSGYETGNNPEKGSILVMQGRNMPLGHVAYVEEVKNNHIVITEMNYKGRGVKNYRSIKKNNPTIAGYIYGK